MSHMSFVKAGFQTLAFRILLLVCSAATGVVHARFLGPEGVGIFVLLLSIKRIAFSLGNLGFGSAFAFFVAQKRSTRREALRVSWILGGLLSVSVAVIFYIVRPLRFSPWNDIDCRLFYITLLTIPLYFFIMFSQRILSGDLRITQINISELLVNGSNLFLSAIFIVALNLGLAGSIAAMVISDSLAATYLLFQGAKKGSVEKTLDASVGGLCNKIGAYWGYGKWNYLIMLVNMVVEEMPRLLLKTFAANNFDIGILTAARNLSQESRLVAIPIAQVLFPYTAASSEGAAVNRTSMLCRNSLFIMGWLSLFAVILIKPLILLLYGNEFLPSVPVFLALLPAMIVFPLNHFIEIHLAASGYPKEACAASFSSLITGALLCIFLIPDFGVIGAGLGISGIAGFRTVSRLWVYRKVTKAHVSDVLIPRLGEITTFVSGCRAIVEQLIGRRKSACRNLG